MRDSLVGLGSELAETRGVRLACRIGVNTGVVVVGRGEEIITGDAVNVAARLEQTAQENHVVLGEETERLVRGAVETSPVLIQAKGKAEPLTAHVLVRVVHGADPLARRADARMVGREDELALLHADVYENCAGRKVPSGDGARPGGDRQVAACTRADGERPGGADRLRPMPAVRRRHHVLAGPRGVHQPRSATTRSQGSGG